MRCSVEEERGTAMHRDNKEYKYSGLISESNVSKAQLTLRTISPRVNLSQVGESNTERISTSDLHNMFVTYNKFMDECRYNFRDDWDWIVIFIDSSAIGWWYWIVLIWRIWKHEWWIVRPWIGIGFWRKLKEVIRLVTQSRIAINNKRVTSFVWREIA